MSKQVQPCDMCKSNPCECGFHVYPDTASSERDVTPEVCTKVEPVMGHSCDYQNGHEGPHEWEWTGDEMSGSDSTPEYVTCEQCPPGTYAWRGSCPTHGTKPVPLQFKYERAVENLMERDRVIADLRAERDHWQQRCVGQRLRAEHAEAEVDLMRPVVEAAGAIMDYALTDEPDDADEHGSFPVWESLLSAEQAAVDDYRNAKEADVWTKEEIEAMNAKAAEWNEYFNGPGADDEQ